MSSVLEFKHLKGRPKKIEIPTSFKVLGHTIKVQKIPSKELEALGREALDGLYDHANKVIYLDETLSYANMEQTYIHEKTHCILMLMGEDELSDNEKFVELMSQISYQIDKTSRGILEVLPYRKGVADVPRTKNNRKPKVASSAV